MNRVTACEAQISGLAVANEQHVSSYLNSVNISGVSSTEGVAGPSKFFHDFLSLIRQNTSRKLNVAHCTQLMMTTSEVVIILHLVNLEIKYE